MYNKLIAAAVSCILLSACANQPPPPVIAQDKTVEFAGHIIILGGEYNQQENKLKLRVNGEPLMQGRFPPYTPTQNLTAKYKELSVSAKCYFGSVLGDQGGAFGVVAGIIQATKSKTADKCEMFINQKAVENLYFDL